MNKPENLISRAEHLLARLEALFHEPSSPVDWKSVAWRWVKINNKGQLQAVGHPHQIALKNIHFVEAQKAQIVRNTQQFLSGFPANNVLLTGARSGRVAYQFARDYTGKMQLAALQNK